MRVVLDSRSPLGLTVASRILRDLEEWLNSINPDLGKKRLPGLKELWKSGDLREKLVASNARISSVRARWQVRGLLRFRMLAMLTVVTARCDCKSAHLCEWTLRRWKRQLYSNRYSSCSNRAQFVNALVLSRCTRKLNRLASIARRRG